MKRTILAIVAAFVCFMPPAAQAEDIVNTAFGFRAYFPCKSNLRSETFDSAVGRVAMNSWECMTNSGVFSVSFSDVPAGFAPTDNKGRADAYLGGAQSAAEGENGVIQSFMPTFLDGIEGNEAIIDSEGKGIRCIMRQYFAGNRLYHITSCVSINDDLNNDKIVIEFMNSFHILK